MRVAIVAMASAGVVVAGAWWMGRDAERDTVGASTTVELAMADGVEARDPSPATGAESAPSEPASRAFRPAASAATSKPEVPDEWVPSERDFAEGEVDESPTASRDDAPRVAGLENDIPAMATPPTAGAVDHDAWRDRIRRMLDVYRRVGALQ